MQNRFYIVVIILLILFFYISASKVINDNSINLKSFNGWMSLVKLYFTWLGHALGNVKVVVGNVIKMDWSGNSTG